MADPTNTQNQYVGNRSGSGFVNLQSILNANQNNKLGQTVARGVNNSVNGIQNQIGQSVNNFNTQANSNLLNNNTNNTMVNTDINNALQGNAASANDVSNFKTLEAGGYNGPTGLSNTAQLQGEAAQGQQLASNVSTPGGQQALLQTYVGNGSPNYGQGQQKLDTLLLGANSGNSQAQLKSAAASAGKLGNSVTNATNSAQALGQSIASQNQAYGQNLNNNLATQQTNITGTQGGTTGIYGQVAQDQANQASELAADQQGLASGNLNTITSPELNGLLGQTNYGLSAAQLQSYLSPEQAATFQNVGTAKNAAQLDALSQLAGTVNTALPGTTAGLGTYNPNQAVTFNTSAFTNANNANQAAQNQASNAAFISGQGSPTNPALSNAIATAKAINPQATNLQGVIQALKNSTSSGDLDPQTQRAYESQLASAQAALNSIAGGNTIFGDHS